MSKVPRTVCDEYADKLRKEDALKYERMSRLKTERDEAIKLLRKAIEEDHIYGNDSEQWLAEVEAFLGWIEIGEQR